MRNDCRIVVLDGYTLNPGDLSWQALHSVGNVTVYDRTAPADVVKRARHAEVVLTNKVPLFESTLEQLPSLRYIGIMATGYNVVDLDAAARRGIVVTNVPEYGTDSVAQFTMALLLELCHRVEAHSIAVQKGEWAQSPDFSFTRSPQVELVGKKLGIVGFGSIGQRVAALGSAFGMDVWVTSRSEKSSQGLKVCWTDLRTLFSTADVISLHCPLTEDTANLIRRETIGWMKPSAFVINTARGGLVIEQDLADALHRREIAGAAVDVLAKEPPTEGSPLLGAPNCIITPHIAWASKEARARLMDGVVENIKRFLVGTPTNVVSAR